MRGFASIAWGVCTAILLFSPMARADSPTTRPQQPTVAVMPFDVLGDGGRMWVGKALQEGLISNFQQRGFQAVAGPAQADFIVTGSVQLIDQQMRITGRIGTSADDKTVGQFHSDGMVHDLFSIEDSLSSKADRLLSPPSSGPMSPAASLAIVGPTLPSPSRYFDGNLAETLKIKDPFTDQAYRYNYEPTQFYWGYYPYGCYAFGGYPCYGWGWGGWSHISPVAPISGW